MKVLLLFLFLLVSCGDMIGSLETQGENDFEVGWELEDDGIHTSLYGTLFEEDKIDNRWKIDLNLNLTFDTIVIACQIKPEKGSGWFHSPLWYYITPDTQIYSAPSNIVMTAPHPDSYIWIIDDRKKRPYRWGCGDSCVGVFQYKISYFVLKL